MADHDPWPLLPRSSTMGAIQAARSRLAEVEDTIGRELSYMAAELDRTRTALDAERALRERIAGECADFKARLLERERELLGDVEVRYDEKGRVDEVVAKRCAHVHLEDMEGSWALIFSDGDRTLNLSITSRRAVVVEQAGVREVRP